MKKMMGGGREVGGKNVEQLSELCVCGRVMGGKGL